MEPSPYRCDVDLHFRELLAYQAYLLLVRRRGWILLALLVAGVAYGVGQLATTQPSVEDRLPALVLLFGLPAFLLAAIFLAARRSYETEWRPELPMSFSFDEEGVKTEAASSTSSVRWRGIEEVRLRGGLVLLFLDRRHAFVIPRRCVSDEALRFLRHKAEGR